MRRPKVYAAASAALALSATITVTSWSAGTSVPKEATSFQLEAEPRQPRSTGGSNAVERLTWAVPTLTEPTVIPVTQAHRDLSLPTDRDFVLQMPAVALTGQKGLRIDGGRNVVLIGGAISVSDVPAGTKGENRRGLVIKNQTGVVHVEGLQISGDDLAEGIQIAAPEAIVQLQNIRITRVSSENPEFHSDVLQVWGGVKALRVDRLTGSSAFQGIFLKSDIDGTEIGSVDLRRVNITGGSGYNFYADDTVGSITTSEVYARPGRTKLWKYSAFPSVASGAWSDVVHGTPRSGDFVPHGTVGPGHTSPVWKWTADPSVVSIHSAEAHAAGRLDGTLRVNAVLTLDKPAGAEVTVAYSVFTDRKIAGGRKQQVSVGQIAFAAGEISRTVQVDVDQHAFRTTDNLHLHIDKVRNASVGTRSRSVRIVQG